LYRLSGSGTLSLLMSTIQLPRNVQFLYEEHLARLEFEALGCHDLVRAGDHWDRMTGTVNGTAETMLTQSAYLGSLDGRPSVYATLTLPRYQGGRFNRTRSVNQYLTHWIYPYQGKFHPQMIRALLNMLGVKPGERICEPYLGSGTTALEASLLGIDCVGVDLSPLCALLARVKTQSWEAVEPIRATVAKLVSDPDLHPDRLNAQKVPGTFAGKVPATLRTRVQEFVEIARMVTLSDVSRRGREGAAALKKNLLAMLESVEAQAQAVNEFGLTPGRVDAKVGDCRDLAASGIDENSIDGVVTSPPYSIALDYVKNDEHALEALKVDVTKLRGVMTGVRGRGASQKLALYNEDMQRMFGEVARVLKPGKPAAFVIGDATVDQREVTTTDEMIGWAETAGLKLERSIPKIVFGLYSIMKDEKILIFRKR
jgi:tRNA G10  N-methylase Trm11